VGGGNNNRSVGEFASVAGGGDNTGSGYGSTIGGGVQNTASGESATIGGGYLNAAGNLHATVGGGIQNSATQLASTVAGGYLNQASDFYTTVAGGNHNQASADHATVSGGADNTATGEGAAVSGGNFNSAFGEAATVPGGYWNTAEGNRSLAAGHRARANHDGSFVWADFQQTDFESISTNEFAIRSTGGVRFVTATDANGLNVAGVALAPGSGSWSSLSDRNAKENFAATNAREILDKVAALPVASWNYKAQGSAVRHLGPTAQDFHATFGLGESDRTISTVDADGVALAAIQGLNEKLTKELKQKETEITELQLRLKRLEQLFDLRNGGTK